jgi:hypothetical protein
MQRYQVPETMAPDALLFRLADGANVEFVPVVAILGGILAQDMIKVISHKDTPIHNLFVYNGLDGKWIKTSKQPMFTHPSHLLPRQWSPPHTHVIQTIIKTIYTHINIVKTRIKRYYYT